MKFSKYKTRKFWLMMVFSVGIYSEVEAQNMITRDMASSNPDKVIISLNESVLADLKARLVNTRWPDQVENDDWAYGTNLAYIQELVEYWGNEFDWQTQQNWLNEFDHYKSSVNGMNLHYIHALSPVEDATPLLLLHGWPGSFIQMLKLVPLLTDPASHGMPNAPAFHVVVASLPGYGFSDAATTPGLGMAGIAELMSGLMTDVLGYERYGVRGSDLGGTTIDQMARNYPEQIIGAHLTQIIAAGGGPAPADASDAEIAFLQKSAGIELSYARMHSSKPQTLAYALTDSPAGLAGWIAEKYYFWGDTKGNMESRFSKDFLLTTLTLYWATQTISPSIRTYYDMVRNRGSSAFIEVPTAFLMSQNDMFPPAPRQWAARTHNVVHFSETDSGGHFLEWEEPELVARDIQAFFSELK